MRDLKNYPGSKNGSGVYQNIINTFPAHDIYIEPFLGSAAIMKKKVPAAINIGIDLNSSIINSYVAGHGFEYINADSISFLSAAVPLFNMMHDQSSRILIYCDPPYPRSTRKRALPLYAHELTDQDHLKFLNVMISAKFFVVISSYENKMYNNILLPAGFNFKSFDTVTRSGPATECIYFNYSLDIPKHEYTFIGDNFRSRAAAKGRVYRNVSKINRMHPDERNFIINLLSQKNQ